MTRQNKDSQAVYEKERKQKDMDFLRRTMQWPCWPICPVKRYDGKDPSGFPTCAVRFDEKKVRVFGILMHTYIDRVHKHMKNPLEGVTCYEYASLEEMLDDGWMVD